MNAGGRQLACSGTSTSKNRLQNLQQWLEEWLQAKKHLLILDIVFPKIKK